MKQFLLPRRYCGEPTITLTGADAHYLTRVLRKRAGDSLPAVTAEGTRYTMTIRELTVAGCVAGLARDAAGERETLPGARIRLLQCLPKGQKMDLIVRQAVEAGVWKIIPLVSTHSIAVPENPGKKAARWQRIAREALQQSGSAQMTMIDEPVAFRDGADLEGASDTGLFFHQERIALDSLHAALAGVEPAGTVSLLIGPEGGLSAEEVEHLRHKGFRPVYLGDTVLRSETAALYAVAAVRTIMRERDTWKLSV